MIRHAQVEDTDALVAMGLRFMRETHYGKQLGENTEQLRRVVEQLIDTASGLLIVAERNGIINGMLGAIMFDHPLSGESTASELFWWTNPEARGDGMKLLRFMEQWAVGRGARRLQMIAPTEHVAKFYERIGFEKIETAYQRNLA